MVVVSLVSLGDRKEEGFSAFFYSGLRISVAMIVRKLGVPSVNGNVILAVTRKAILYQRYNVFSHHHQDT